MESITNGTEDFLIDGLSFKLPPGASYVTDRRSVSYFAIGSNIYTSTSGVKLLKFQLNGDDGNWLDPSSVVIQFTVKNNDGTNRLYLNGGPHLFFNRCRILAGGQVVEDIQDFNRYQEMITSLMNSNVRENIDSQGFGNRWDSPKVLDATGIPTYSAGPPIAVVAPTNAANNLAKLALLGSIAANGTKIVNFKPLVGIFNQSKFIPLKFCPITIELQLDGPNAALAYPEITFTGDWTGAPAMSNTWEINNAQIKCDICTLDNALNNSYVEHLLSGKALPIEYSTYISQQSAISGNNLAIQVVRAVSRLQRAFITLYKNPTGLYIGPFNKQSIQFYHPNVETRDGVYASNRELEFQIQLGSKLYPEYPCTSISECFYRLKEALNLPDYHQHSLSIRYQNYYQDKFIFALSFEKITDAEWSGVNTKAGQVMLVKVKATDSATVASIGDIMYTVLEAQQILEIRDVGCTIYD